MNGRAVNRRILLVVVAIMLTAAGMGSVYAYANQADRRAAEGQKLVTVLVATSRIPAGTEVGRLKGMLKEQQVPVAVTPAGALSSLPAESSRVTGQDVLLGETLLADMLTEPSTAAQNTTLLALPPGKVAMGVSLEDRQQVGGFVRPGDFVAVYVTSDWNKERAVTKLVLRRVQVLSVARTSNRQSLPKGPSGDQANATETVVTLAVDVTQGATLAHAAEVGNITLALEDSKSSTKGADTPVGNAQVFGGRS